MVHRSGADRNDDTTVDQNTRANKGLWWAATSGGISATVGSSAGRLFREGQVLPLAAAAGTSPVAARRAAVASRRLRVTNVSNASLPSPATDGGKPGAPWAAAPSERQNCHCKLTKTTSV